MGSRSSKWSNGGRPVGWCCKQPPEVEGRTAGKQATAVGEGGDGAHTSTTRECHTGMFWTKKVKKK